MNNINASLIKDYPTPGIVLKTANLLYMNVEETDKRVYELHKKVMELFMGSKCYDIDGELLIECVKDELAELGLKVITYSLFDIDGNEVNDPNNARYLRVETQGPVPGKHIFTFAIIKSRGKFRVLYLQSAVG